MHGAELCTAHAIDLVLFGAVAALTVSGAATLVFGGTFLSEKMAWRRLLPTAICLLLLYAAVCWAQPDIWWFADGVLVLAAVACGALLARPLGSVGALVAFCVTASVVDVVSFSGGLTDHIITAFREGESKLLLYLAVSIPFDGAVRPIVGIGDLAILAGIFRALMGLGYSRTLTFLVPTGGLLVALVLGLTVGGIYALPFVAGATSIYALIARPDRRTSRVRKGIS